MGAVATLTIVTPPGSTPMSTRSITGWPATSTRTPLQLKAGRRFRERVAAEGGRTAEREHASQPLFHATRPIKIPHQCPRKLDADGSGNHRRS